MTSTTSSLIEKISDLPTVVSMADGDAVYRDAVLCLIRQNGADQIQAMGERVARAICISYKQDPDFEYTIGQDSNPLLKQDFKLWQNYASAADAAIAAMMEVK